VDIRRRRCHDSVRGATSAVHRARPHVAEPAMSSTQHAGFPQRSPRPTSTPDRHASSLPARPAPDATASTPATHTGPPSQPGTPVLSQPGQPKTRPLLPSQAHRTTSQLSHSQPRPASPCRAHGTSGCSATPRHPPSPHPGSASHLGAAKPVLPGSRAPHDHPIRTVAAFTNPRSPPHTPLASAALMPRRLAAGGTHPSAWMGTLRRRGTLIYRSNEESMVIGSSRSSDHLSRSVTTTKPPEPLATNGNTTRSAPRSLRLSGPRRYLAASSYSRRPVLPG
jgi:hypothetical protein